jgi:hypothetical protein
MTTPKIDFTWTRAFARSPGEPAYECSHGKIRQVGRGKQQFSPFAQGDLFLEFSQLDGSEGACVGFAEKWGLLEHHAYSKGELPFEEISKWRAAIRTMKINVRMLPQVIRIGNSRGTFAKVGKVDVLLVPGVGPGASPVLVMEPGDLLQAMNLQMAQFVAGGGVPSICRECGRAFGAGGAGKRSDAKFCSDSCRNRFHYSKQRKAKL